MPSQGGVRTIAMNLFVIVGCASGSQDRADPTACATSEECRPFGEVVTCDLGHCHSAGLACAEKAGLHGTDTVNGESFTIASALEEWIRIANGHLVADYCAAVGACGGYEAPCHEEGLDRVDGTCCQATLDFYVAHRDALHACPVQGLTCDELSFEAFCPAMNGVTFESLCAGQ